MQKRIEIFPEEKPIVFSVNLKYLKRLKKSAAILLVFLFVFSPIASALAAATSTDDLASSTKATMPPSISVETPILIPNAPTTESSPANQSPQVSEVPVEDAKEPTPPPPSMLDSGNDPDPRIDSPNQRSNLLYADESSGALITSYPITIPPGRNGFQPDLKLEYNSQNSSQIDSVFGAGWSLNIPYIEKVNKSGVNNLYPSNTTTPVYLNSSLSGELIASTTATSTFSSRIDNGEFLNYTFANSTWTVKDKKGNTYVFGTADTTSGTTSPGGLYSTSLYNDANLVSYYQMEGDANDSKSTNHGTSTSITYSTANGKYNQGAGFGGSSNINLGDPASLDVSQITIAYWLQVGDLSADSVPTSKWDSDPNSWVMYIDGSGSSGFTDKIRFNVIVNEQAPSWNLKATSNDALTTGTWYHVVATYDGSTVKLYINGTLQNETTSITGSIRASNAEVKIGSWLSNNSTPLPNGSKVDDFAIFSRALNSTEVGTLYNAAAPTSPELNGSRLNDPFNSNNINKWMLDYVLDPNGNQIKYNYYKNNGQLYPSSVTYAGNSTSSPLYSVNFTREARTDTSTSSKPGFQIVTESRIKDIQVKMNSALVRKYDLAYTAGVNGRRALLSSVTENGINENGSTTTLPSIMFTYQDRDSGFASGSYTSPTLMQNAILADVNGDGYGDIVRAYTDTSTTSLITYLNNTNGGWATSTAYASPVAFYGTGTSCDPLCDKGYRLVDINGDGLTDIFGSSATYMNTGSSWSSASSTWTSPLAFSNPNQNYGNQGYAEIGDVNGDGLQDVFKVWHTVSEGYSDVYLNNGSGFTYTSAWSVATGIDKQARQNADLNGDSLTDLVQSFDSTGNGDYYNFAAINNSTSSFISYPPFDPISAGYFVVDTTDKGYRILDFNSDGLPDIVRHSNDTYGANQAKGVYLNTGNGWTSIDSNLAPTVPLVMTNIPADSSARLGDLNGDGTTDAIRGINFSGNFHGESTVNEQRQTDVLTKITYPEGGSTNITYKPSGQYKDGSNNLLNPNLPFSVNTVYKILQHDGTATSSTDTFTYKGGKYYYNGPFDRRLAGFSEIHKTDAGGNITKTFYHQADVNATSTSQGEYQDNYWKIGKPYRVEKYDANNNLIEKTINKWDVATTSLGTGFVKLAQTVVSTYEGDTSHKDKAEAYTYNNSTGNITTKVEYGEVTGSDDGTFSDTGTDDFTTTYTYATSSTSSVVSLLSSQSTVDHNSNKVKEFKLYYDGLSFGRADKGNVTKREDWKTGSTYVDVEKTYNSYGLVLTEKDPRDKTTTYTYDSNNLYPATVTNPVSHVSQFAYDYSSGKVATTTDPNGNIFVNVYDGLDRLIEQKQPNPSSTSTLETKLAITYSDNRNGFKVQQTNYLTSTSTVDSYLYLDGLKRKKQERAEAEGSNFTVKDYIYDTRGLLQKETLPYFSSGSASTTATSTAALYINYYYDAIGRMATTSNAVGTTTNAYLDWQVKVTDPKGAVKDLYYDAFGSLKQVDEHNASSTYSTNYTYNYLGNLLSVTDSASNVRNFTYDGLGRRLTAQDLHASGDGTYGSYTYTYDDAGNITQQVDPKSQTMNYTYDDINRQLTEDYTGQGGTEVTYTYDACTQGKGKLCTASSTEMTLTKTYNALGQLTQEVKVISGNSYTTAYTYDRQGNQLTITNPDSSIVSYVYNAAGQIEQLQRKESTDSGYIDVVTNFDYSPLGQLTVIEYANCSITTNTYDSSKLYRLTRKITTSPGCGESLMSESPSEEESLVAKPPLEQEITDTLISTSTPATSTMVDISTNTLSSISTTTATSTLESVPTNETASNPSTTPSSTPESTSTTTPDEVIPVPESTTGATSDSPVSTTTPAESGSVTESTPLSTNQSQSFFAKVYSAVAGGFSWFINGIGNVAHKAINFALDTFSIKTAYAVATELYSTSLINDPNLVSYYRMEGNSNDAVSSNNGTDTSITYNSGNGKFNQGAGFGGSSNISLGDPASLDVSQISIAFWLQVGDLTNDSVPASKWDSDPNSWVMYIDGSGSSGFTDKLRFNVIINEQAPSWNLKATSNNALTTGTWYHVVGTYDGSTVKLYINGTLQSDYTSISGTIRASSAAFKIGSWLNNNSTALPNGSKVDDFAVFNRALTATEVDYLYNGFPDTYNIQDITYTYDSNGNITQITDVSETNSVKIVTYSYDDLNRLTNASTTAASTTPFNYSYTYDALGNMLTRVENGTTTTYTYATNTPAYLNPHAVATTTAGSSLAYTYDNNGNLLTVRQGTSTPSSSYTWDYNNRLTQAVTTTGGNATSTFSYDPSGQRVKMTVATTSSVITYYPSKGYNITGSVPTKHIFLPDGTMIATIVGTGTSTTVSYIHTDHLGGMNVATDDGGSVVALADQFPYGNTRIDEQSGLNEQRKGISGHEYDSNTGLTYANARYYNGANGQFISQDPAFINLTHLNVQLTDPQSWNSYAYARNNPIIFIDQYGNMWTPWQSSGGFTNWMGNGGLLYNVYGSNVNSITATAQNIQQNGWTSDNVMALGADAASITAKTSGVIVGSVTAGMAPELVKAPASVSTVLQAGGAGALGGIAAQGYSDIRSGQFSGVKEYGFQGAKGFAIGASGTFGPLVAGLTAAGGSAADDAYHGRQVSGGDALYNGTVSSLLTFGFGQLPQTRGANPSAFSRSFFTGAHAQRALLDEFFQTAIQGTADKVKNTITKDNKK